jgi:hypothetical protein
MTTTEERLRVLKMVEEGKVTAEQGAQLLAALKGEGPRQKSEEPLAGRGKQPRRLRIQVTNLETGQRKVNVNIPIGLVDVGLKMGARFAPDMDGFDFAQVAEAIRQGVQGKIIDVEDSEDGERVEIYVE